MSIEVSARRLLGSGRVEVTRVGLGTAALGSLYSHVPDADATEVVHRALAAGIGYVDTAPHYGVGLAETRLGAALAGRPDGLPDPVTSTKAGRLLVQNPGADPGIFADAEGVESNFDFTADGVRRSIAESLERLDRDHVDIVYLHDPDDHADQAIDEAYPALHQMREERIVGAIGVGMNQSAVPARFVRETDIDVVLLAGRFTLLDRSAEADLLPACRERGVSVVVGGVFNSGLLADPRPGARYDYAPVSTATLDRAQALARICDSYDVPLKAAALQFPHREPCVASVLLGCRSVAELEENLELLALDIPDALWEELCE